MVASDPARDGPEPVRTHRTAVLRPAAADDAVAEPAGATVSPAGSSAPEDPALRPAAGKVARPGRQILIAAAIACVIAAGAVVAGRLVAEDSPVDTSALGLRRVTVPEDEPAGTAAPQEGSGGSAEQTIDVDPSGEETPDAGLADGASPQSGSAGAVQPSDVEQLGGAYPAPLVSEEPVVAVAKSLAPSVVRIEIDSVLGPGVGAGIVWDAENGYIVTNHHVVEGKEEVTVRFADGSQVAGEVLGGSPGHDVAVVQVDPDEAELVAATFAPTSSVRVGQLAVAIGSPFGLTGTVTAGIVSAVRIHGGGGSDPDFAVPVEMIQTDAAINSGNSGGALADWQARVIGMNTFIQTTTGGSIGLGFAVPSDTVELIATRVVNGESLELGYLGISSAGGDEDTLGVPVSEVVPDSPAEKAGLEPGDVILSMDGKDVQNIAELSAAVKLRSPGETVELEIERAEERYIATVELGTWG